MTDTDASFNLTCFDDDFEKHTEEINEYYECKYKFCDTYFKNFSFFVCLRS